MIKIINHLDIIDIKKTIKWIETRDREDAYSCKGKSGEYGAYQFTRSTWRYLCKKYFNEVLDIKEASNQNLIAHKRIEELLKRGYNPAQIASIWNCGSPKWQGKIGTNKYGIKCNVRFSKGNLKRFWKKLMNMKIF